MGEPNPRLITNSARCGAKVDPAFIKEKLHAICTCPHTL